MPFAITGELNWRGLGVHTVGTRLEVCDTAAEAAAVAQRFREEGYAEVRTVEIATGRAPRDAGPNETAALSPPTPIAPAGRPSAGS